MKRGVAEAAEGKESSGSRSSLPVGLEFPGCALRSVSDSAAEGWHSEGGGGEVDTMCLPLRGLLCKRQGWGLLYRKDPLVSPGVRRDPASLSEVSLGCLPRGWRSSCLK